MTDQGPMEPGYRARAEAAEQRVAELEAMVDELAAAHKSAHADWSKERTDRIAAEAREQALRDRVAKTADRIDSSPIPQHLVSKAHHLLADDLREALLSPPTAEEKPNV